MLAAVYAVRSNEKSSLAGETLVVLIEFLILPAEIYIGSRTVNDPIVMWFYIELGKPLNNNRTKLHSSDCSNLCDFKQTVSQDRYNLRMLKNWTSIGKRGKTAAHN